MTLNLVGDTVGFVHAKRKAGKSILIEGANGALLDIDFGRSNILFIPEW